MVDVTTRAILLADVSRSTPLYQKVGDVKAVNLIAECIDRMFEIAKAHGGTVVSSRGDDVICVFEDPLAAVEAAGDMLQASPSDEVAVHAGLHWGSCILTRNEAFGDAVNLTARLASLSNDGEVLMSAEIVSRLPPEARGALRSLDAVTLKGSSKPLEVWSFLLPSAQLGSQVTFAGHARQIPPKRAPGMLIRLSYGALVHDMAEGQDCVIGRSADCHLILDGLWVSRRHAQAVLRGGVLEYTDKSTTGSYIRLAGGEDVFVRRQALALTGSGLISPGMPVEDAGESVIEFGPAEPD